MQWSAFTEQLFENSIAIADNVLDSAVLDQLRLEAMQDYEAGTYHEARIGKGALKQRIDEVRSDRVRWLNSNEASPAQAEYWQMIGELRGQLSDYFRIHLERTELHFAYYPKGAFYAPHVDQFRDHGNRVFSVITYLNPHWEPSHGGMLRIYNDEGGVEDIAPVHGRLVCFRSDTVKHEVLKTMVPRISITGWMRRDPLII